MAVSRSLVTTSATRRELRRHPPGDGREVGDRPGLLALQRLAGNRAVAAFVGAAVQRACQDGTWRYEYDGCSVPGVAQAVGRGQRGAFDKDNPAGGRDTHFALGKPTTEGGVACDRHDECYQSCGTDRAACDLRMYADMKAVCAASGENATVRSQCVQFATIYYKALRAGAEGAFEDRKSAVCGCDPTLLPPALRLPPRHLLERNGRPVGWLDYKIMSSYPPLSAYKAIVSQEEFERYLADPELPDFEAARRALQHL